MAAFAFMVETKPTTLPSWNPFPYLALLITGANPETSLYNGLIAHEGICEVENAG